MRISPEEMTDRNDWQTWVFSVYFLESQLSEPVTSRKTTGNICCHDRIQAFKKKLEFWETCIHLRDL